MALRSRRPNLLFPLSETRTFIAFLKKKIRSLVIDIPAAVHFGSDPSQLYKAAAESHRILAEA